MTATLRDRVAEAIYEVDPHWHHDVPGDPESGGFLDWAGLQDDYRAIYLECAEAAVRVCLRDVVEALRSRTPLPISASEVEHEADFIEREFADGALKGAGDG